jgi:hypothetical protein
MCTFDFNICIAVIEIANGCILPKIKTNIKCPWKRLNARNKLKCEYMA